MEWIFTPCDRVIMRNILGSKKVWFTVGHFGGRVFTCSNLFLVQVSVFEQKS